MGKVETLPRRESAPDAPARPGDEPASRPRRGPSLRAILLVLGPVIVLAGALFFYLAGGRYVGIDNAYIRAGLVELAPEVSGRVAEIAVRDNQQVAAGDTLFRIDPEPFRIARDAANAELAVIAAELEAGRATYGQKLAEIDGAEADVAFYRRSFDRQRDLARRQVAAQTALDEAEHALKNAEQLLAALRQEARALLAGIGDLEAPVTRHPRYLAARAEVETAERNLRLTQVAAPVAGIVTNVGTLQVGEYLTAGSPALAMVGNGDMWVEANPKETDLAQVQAGDPATVTVDAYPDLVWQAHVDTLSPATGSAFSVLPAQNTSGNWVKVVQRLPVRIALDDRPGAPMLRSGLSVEVEIDTGEERSLGGLAHTLFGWLGA